MSRESPDEGPLSVEELTDLLADATDTTPEEIERQAAQLDIESPDEATLVDE